MIPQRYSEGTAVLIANGPSLTEEQVALCAEPYRRGCLHTFGCKDAYRICDFLEHLYAPDIIWINHYRDQVKHLALDRWTCNQELRPSDYPEWRFIGGVTEPGLSTDREYIHHGQHSGYQMINLAYLMGCSAILLLGYDCRGGGRHWFGEQPHPAMRCESPYENWKDEYESIAVQTSALDLTIVNCTPGSAIDCFPRADLAETLEALCRA